MKDGYSFHLDQKSLEETYQEVRKAYRRIFQRLSLECIPVEADTGAMGGYKSEEFVLPSEVGEERYLLCSSCSYRAHREKAEFLPSPPYPRGNPQEEKSLKPTPGKKTIEEVTSYLGVSPLYSIKTVLYESDKKFLILFLPGDRELNESILKKVFPEEEFSMAEEESIYKILEAPPGFIGPYNLKVKTGDKKEGKEIYIFYDSYLKGRSSLVAGANEKDKHYMGLSEGRDFIIQEKEILPLSLGREKDECPRCRSPLEEIRGLELGHIFQLGDKYTRALDLKVLSQEGEEIYPLMGCYGIGVGRTLAAIAEKYHDDKGLTLPEEVSPFLYYLIGIFQDEKEKKEIDAFYEELIKRGVSVYYDDREERAGVKFHDADLVGFPYQIILGRRYLEEGKIEKKDRRTGERKLLSKEEFFSILEKNSHVRGKKVE